MTGDFYNKALQGYVKNTWFVLNRYHVGPPGGAVLHVLGVTNNFCIFLLPLDVT